MYSCLRDNHLLTKEEHGLLEKSLLQQLLSQLCIPIWQKIIDSRGHVTVCFLDYTKAFDSINLDLLFVKLQAYGVEGCFLKFSRSFLIGRTQRVMVNCATSDTYETRSGVPHGACLGPLMFLLYMNDLPSCLARCTVLSTQMTLCFTLITTRRTSSLH